MTDQKETSENTKDITKIINLDDLVKVSILGDCCKKNENPICLTTAGVKESNLSDFFTHINEINKKDFIFKDIKNEPIVIDSLPEEYTGRPPWLHDKHFPPDVTPMVEDEIKPKDIKKAKPSKLLLHILGRV
jgi:hypothetical protein